MHFLHKDGGDLGQETQGNTRGCVLVNWPKEKSCYMAGKKLLVVKQRLHYLAPKNTGHFAPFSHMVFSGD